MEEDKKNEKIEDDTDTEIKEDNVNTDKKEFNWLTLITIIVGAAFLVSIYTNGFTTFGQKSDNEIKTQVTDFINKNFLSGQDVDFKIINAKDISKNGLYELDIEVNDLSQKIYATADGQLLFLQAVPMKEQIQQPAQTTQNAGTPPPKTDKPQVDLYVMSYCPFGVLAEKNFIPALELLGDKISFNLYFIASEQNNVFGSLHGQKEVEEDLRQVCIMKNYPSTYLKYISCQVPNFEAGKDLGTTYETCLTQNSMDIQLIKTCYVSEGAQLLRENIKSAQEKNVQGSPTWEVNGVRKVGADPSESFKGVVCSAFNTAPEECGQTLSTTSTSAAGNCPT